VTFKRGDNVKAARDVALGQDIVVRAGCPGRIAQRIGALNHKYVVLFTSRDDIAENDIIVKGLGCRWARRRVRPVRSAWAAVLFSPLRFGR
jgi:hypothetical protein